MSWIGKRVKALQSPYAVVLARVLEAATRIRLESYRNPWLNYDYAEAHI